MAIIRATLEKVTGSENSSGRTYEAKYLVKVDDRNDHAATIISGMPWRKGFIYQIGNDLDPDAVVLSMNADPEPKNNFYWNYVVNFGPREEVDDPFAEPTSIELSFAQGEKLLERDINGKPIRNTVGDRFDDVLTREDSQPILKVTRNEPASQFMFGVDLRDTINRSPWLGAPRRTVKFQPPRKSSRIHPNPEIGIYYQADYEFKFSDDTWRLILLNQGYYEKGEPAGGAEPDGPVDTSEGDEKCKARRIKILDCEGDPITAPLALSKAGKALKKDEEPHWLEFDGYRESLFPDFGLLL